MKKKHGAPLYPVVLIILDGFGANPSKRNNAVAEADTPRLDDYFARYPHTLLHASGSPVGLPPGQMGNSEVGHLTLGCGKLMRQDLVSINDAIADGSLFANPVLVKAMVSARERACPLHLLGLVSDGGIHSHLRHLLALIQMCKRQRVQPLLHMITDGRDTAPKFALNFIAEVEPALNRAGGAIATVCGRYYAMDRDHHWDRTEIAWQAIARAKGRRLAGSSEEAVHSAYGLGQTDEFIEPTVLPEAIPLSSEDSIIFFNFRKDRPRQMVSALSKKEFQEFDRGRFEPLTVTCMMQYDQWSDQPYAFLQDLPSITLSQILSEAGLKQFHCAETEKYAHVSYFFNGGRGDVLPGEDHQVIPSPNVATYDLAPEMSAMKVADAVIEAIEGGEYAFIVVNFANGDMVGHTAIREAVLQAVETLDREAGRVMDHAVEAGYAVILTADHGNCDEMVDPITGAPHTQHTPYPVPCLVVNKQSWQLESCGSIAAISPTILHLLGLTKPTEMSANSLLLQPIRNV